MEGQDIPTLLWRSHWQCFGMHMAFFSSWAMWRQWADADAGQNWGHWRKQSGQITLWVQVSSLLGINGLCFGQTSSLISLMVVCRNRVFRSYLLLFGKSLECNILWDVTYWMPAVFHIRGSEAARSGSVQLTFMWKMVIVSCGISVWLFHLQFWSLSLNLSWPYVASLHVSACSSAGLLLPSLILAHNSKPAANPVVSISQTVKVNDENF